MSKTRQRRKTMGTEFNRKSYSFIAALAIGTVGSIIWLIMAITSVNYSFAAIATTPILFGSLLLAWYNRVIGGLAIIISSLVPIIIVFRFPLFSDPYYEIFIVYLLFSVTLPLLVSGILFIVKGTRSKQEKMGTTDLEGEPLDYRIVNCPKCGSSNIIEKLIYQADSKDEKQSLGYKTKWQRTCSKCKLKWIVVEK